MRVPTAVQPGIAVKSDEDDAVPSTRVVIWAILAAEVEA